MNVKRVIAGSVAGSAATVVMSGWMLVGQALTNHGELSPKRVLRGLAHISGVPTKQFGPVTLAATSLAHLGFGAGCGALYGTTVRPSSVPRGILFACAVWASSYAGWIPALGLLPPPQKDRPGRVWNTLAAHLVFGAALGAAVRYYDRAEAGADLEPGAADPDFDGRSQPVP